MNEDVILGTLLGDAWIQRQVRKNKIKTDNYNYIFAFEQSTRAFVEWKAKLIGLPFTIKERDRFDKRTLKLYHTVHCHLSLNKKQKEFYYNLFYTPKKEVSIEILNKLTNLSVAIWFLDDGNIYYNGNNCHLTLSVNGFSKESKNCIIGWFQEKYNITFKFSQKAIRITSKRECLKFMQIIKDYIPECMKHKKLEIAIQKHKNNINKEHCEN